MIDQEGNETGKKITKPKSKKRKIVSNNSVKFIVPMPGSASWMLKPNDMNDDRMSDHDFTNSFNSDNSAEHSHLIMSRKYYID